MAELLTQPFSRRRFVAGAALLQFLDLEPAEEFIPYYTKEDPWKRRNLITPGYKLITVTGMGSVIADPIFDELINYLGIESYDRLKMPYRTNTANPLLGEPFDATDSTQNPEKSLEHMTRMMQWNIAKFRTLPKYGNRPDKYLLFCHSQGAWLGYRLALTFPQEVDGIFCYDGALKGADIVPSDVDESIAPFIGREAATFHLRRAKDPNTEQEVENNVAQLVQNGMFFGAWGSTTDRLVTPRYSTVRSASRSYRGITLDTQFPMGEWSVDLSMMNRTTDELKSRLKAAQLPVSDEKAEEGSARLIDQAPRTSDEKVDRIVVKVQEGLLGHFAVVHNGTVLQQTKQIVAAIMTPRTAAETDPTTVPFRQRQEAVAAATANSYSGINFSLYTDFSTAQYVVVIPRGHEAEGNAEFDEYLRQNGVLDRSWILERNLRIEYR